MTENPSAPLVTIEMDVAVAPHLKIETKENTSIANWHIFRDTEYIKWDKLLGKREKKILDVFIANQQITNKKPPSNGKLNGIEKGKEISLTYSQAWAWLSPPMKQAAKTSCVQNRLMPQHLSTTQICLRAEFSSPRALMKLKCPRAETLCRSLWSIKSPAFLVERGNASTHRSSHARTSWTKELTKSKLVKGGDWSDCKVFFPFSIYNHSRVL